MSGFQKSCARAGHYSGFLKGSLILKPIGKDPNSYQRVHYVKAR